MTYIAQLLVNCHEMRLNPWMRPAAHKDLVAQLDPALRRGLTQVDLLTFVSARVGIEQDSGKRKKVSEATSFLPSLQLRERESACALGWCWKEKLTASARPYPVPQTRPRTAARWSQRRS